MIRKVVKFIPKTKSVKHIHMHKVYISKKGKKKKKKFGKLKKLVKKLKKKKMSMSYHMYDDGCNNHRRSDCATCPACPVYCMPMMPMITTPSPTAIPGLPDVNGLSALAGLLAGRRRRDVNGMYSNETLPVGNMSASLAEPLFDPFAYDRQFGGPRTAVNFTTNLTNSSISSSNNSSQPVFSKRMGLLPFNRRLAAECIYPEQQEEETEGDDGSYTLGGDEDGGRKRRRKRSFQSSYFNRELDKMHERKMRVLERSLLLGPRIQFFDHEGWSFFGRTIPFVNSSSRRDTAY